jgi:hypothetical protein
MDYRKAKKIFATNKTYGTDWRRQMAAGHRQAGGKILHMARLRTRRSRPCARRSTERRKLDCCRTPP